MSAAGSGRDLTWRWLGRIAHAKALAEQEARRDHILAGDDAAQAVLLCEHEPIITLGRSARPDHVLVDAAALAARGVALAQTERGGDVTYHGPGQLMIYPVVRARAGVVALLAAVGAAIAELCAELGLPGVEFRRDPAGVWCGDRKLAACGLHLRRGVVVHGFALDVATPEEMWRLINPCGLGRPGTSIAAALAERGAPPPPPLPELAARLGPGLVARLV